MSYRRRQATFSRAIANARPINLNPKGWGENIEPGVWVTTFGRHGAGQPAIDGEVVRVKNGAVIIRTKINGEVVERNRSISSVRKVGQ